MRLSVPTVLAALIGGAALTLDAILITIANSSVGLIDNVLWLAGLVGAVTASALAGRDLTRRLNGTRRWFATTAVAIALIALTAVALVALDAAGAAITDANRGVHDELGTFCAGLFWLGAGLTGRRGSLPALSLLSGLLITLGLASSGDARTISPPTVHVSLDGHRLGIPDELPGGAVSLSVAVGGGAPDRTLSFVRLDPGVTLAQALGRAARHQGNLDYLTGYAAVVLDAQVDHGHATAEVSLRPGRYVALDSTAPDPAQWKHAPFTVASAGAAAALPRAGATVSMIDFAFRGATRLHEGELVRYRNAGFVTHMALGLEVANTTAARAASADLRAGRDHAAEQLARRTYAFSGAISPGAVQQQPVATPPGIYVLGCFMSTQDGREHTRLGMVRTVTVVR